MRKRTCLLLCSVLALSLSACRSGLELRSSPDDERQGDMSADAKRLGDYLVKDPKILEIAREILSTSDAEAGEVPIPNPHPDAQWFPKAGLGLFMHWGIHSVVGAQPSWAMLKNCPFAGPVPLHPPEKYFALAERFKPDKWNPDEWMGLAKDAGFNYAVLTTKHHDGYALWPSKYGNFSTRQYFDGRDLLEPYVEACRKYGVKVGFYFSPRDWHYPNYLGTFEYRGKAPPVDPVVNRKRFEQFFAYTIGQLHELLTRYGKIDVLWFDGMGWSGVSDMHTKAVYKWIRSLQPGIVINERWGSAPNPDNPNESIRFGDFITFECRQPKERPEGWWEMCHIWDGGGGWGYDTGERTNTMNWVLNYLLTCRRWGGNFLPNVGPRPDGGMTRGFYERCAEMKAWMATYRESVDGADTSPDDECAGVTVTTRGTNTWYLHLANWIPRPTEVWARKVSAVKSCTSLSTGKGLSYREKDGKIWVTVPDSGWEVVKIDWGKASDK